MSSIGSIGSSNSSWMLQGMRQHPDAAKIAENLFSKLDTSGQGYIQKSDLQAAYDRMGASSSSSSSSASTVDDLFSMLDADSNGKVSKQEFTDTLAKLQNDLEQQYQGNRMQMAMQASGTGGMNGMGGMPPPPPRGEGPSLSKDELASELSQIGTSDSRSEMMSNILNNFEAADTDSDGKVSFQEAMAYQHSSTSSSSSTTAAISDSSASASSSSSNSSEAKIMMQIMKLMQAYDISNDQNQYGGLMSGLSVSA